MKTKEEIETLLNEPLDSDVIETRKGGRGTKLQYIPGWYAIAKANQIFGADGWERETIRMDFYPQDDKIHAVAKCRVKVYFYYNKGEFQSVVREGTGGGTGWNPDDYEDAAKEAEKDALKRALATFGQQFGLSLYQGGGETTIDLDGLSSQWFGPKQRRKLREAWSNSDVGSVEAKEIFQKAEDEEWTFEETMQKFSE